jgi:hypothetical protein
MKRAPSVAKERSFGLAVGAVFGLFGAWWLFRGKFVAAAPYVLGAGIALILLGATAPRLLATPFRLWMGLAEGLSFVMTRVILSIVFFCVVTPIGLVRRLLGADPLRRRAGRGESYWEAYPARQRETRHYEKMY